TSAHPVLDKRVFQRHALLLHNFGHEVILVAPNEKGTVQESGITIHGFPRAKTKAARLAQLPGIFRLARSLRGDVYHLHDPDLLAIGWRLRQSLGVPVVYDAHEDFSVQRNVAGISGRIGRFVSRMIGFGEKVLARRLDAVVCPHRIRLAELQHPRKPGLFLPNYPPEDLFGTSTTVAESGRAVVYSGLLSKSRGAELILDAAEKMSDVRFILLAKFMVASEHEWFTSELKRRSAPNIDFRGFVPFEDMPAELRRARAGIMPWLRTPQHVRAAQPSKLYEYMACGLPVVAADLPITREIVAGNGCGLLHEPGNVDSFIEKTYAILNDPERASEMGVKGIRAFRARYTYQTAGQELIDMYAFLVANNPHDKVGTVGSR
ncbi:MAG TPA: glycosyltransferase family 4 protein, partial [Gemmatimonadaceae bacterium]|nr:glycosyltransferase family 4 protein [Gemmatimonadaceae bacterium]